MPESVETFLETSIFDRTAIIRVKIAPNTSMASAKMSHKAGISADIQFTKAMEGDFSGMSQVYSLMTLIIISVEILLDLVIAGWKKTTQRSSRALHSLG